MNIISVPHLASHSIKVLPVDEEDIPNIASYQWEIPSTWNVSYPSKDMHEICIDSVSSMQSAIVSCIVTYTDSTIDTVKTFVHFVGEDYETIQQQNKRSINQGTFVGTTEDIEIYPNPTKNLINVVLPLDPTTPSALFIQDITGRLVTHKVLYHQHNTVSLPSLQSGIYIVKVYLEGKEYIKRISIM